MPDHSLSKWILLGTLLAVCIFWVFLVFTCISTAAFFLSLPDEMSRMDFAGGTVVHTGGWTTMLYFLPLLSFLFLRWYDRGCWSTRLGRFTLVAGAGYYLISLLFILLMISVLPIRGLSEIPAEGGEGATESVPFEEEVRSSESP